LQDCCAVILAAGEGKRMKSNKPKVLHTILFKPMLDWVIDSVKAAGVEDLCVVCGHLNEQVEKHLEGITQTALQSQILGTGHAVMQASDFLTSHTGGQVLILCGDAPLICSDTIKKAYETQISGGYAATIITANSPDPYGYGRIVRTPSGVIAAIVEQKDADDETKKINEINSGGYWFEINALLEVVSKLKNNNASGEYYLPDAVDLLINNGRKVGAYQASYNEVLGANDRQQLSELGEIARKMMIEHHMKNGVSIPCKDGVIIGADVKIGEDTEILPGSILRGNTTVGSDCIIGPNSLLENMTVGNGVKINASQCYQSIIHNESKVGPFSHIRPNSVIGEHVKLGDFVEIKNSVLGEGTSVSHLTYVGDSDVGRYVNFGCGCVTVNYDGINKARTTIGDHAFIGCNTNLIAPVRIGNGAYTAAGSTITDDIPDESLGIARSHQVVKDGWAKDKIGKKKK
jgi:bifunctional UDP-N-acetylglucosamine pyrophosphorylase/glucosamine-1-phosphate N-acetyltransferase